MLDFRILGPVEVVDEQGAIALGGRRQRALLTILLLRRGEVLTSDRLIDELWGEHAPATATKTLQGYVSHLRRSLGGEVLLTRGGGYLLAVDSEQVDAERFERLVGDGRDALAHGDGNRARELLVTALELWRGEALADLAYEPFAATTIARLEEARLAAREDRIEADLMLGRHRGLVGELETIVAQHPHRERPRAQLMRALYRGGRQAEALEVYGAGRQVLDEQLGLEPGPELRTLQQRILDHDPTLDQPAVIPVQTPSHPGASGRWRLYAIGGALLLGAAIAAAVVELTGGSVAAVRAAPNSVAAINARTNEVAAAVAVGARPSAIAFGSGSLWVANLDDQTISRVNPSTLAAQRTIPMSEPPTGIATADGSAWVASSNPSATSVEVTRIDPQFDATEQTAQIGNVVPGTPAAIAAGGGSLWVAPNAGQLTRLDASSGQAVTAVNPNASPTGLAVGAGAVWMTDTSADNVIRVDPTGVMTTVPVGHEPDGIAVGADGVWVADSGDDDVVRIDPSTDAVTTTIPVGDAPSGVAVGDGSVWVADSGDGTVTRIDPHSGRPVTIDVGGSPQAIAIVGDRAWVTVDALTIPPAAGTAGGTLRVDSSVDVGPLDPALSNDPAADQVLYATCAELVNYPDRPGPAGSQLVPEVAQSLPVVSDGGRTYTFTIRTGHGGFRFSSGAPVTAETFKATIERALNPRMHSPLAYDYNDIVGAAAFMAGTAPHISGVVASGNKLTIRLVAPAPDLPARMANPAMCAVPSDTPINPQGERVIPSAGPYTVASYTPNQGIVLVRNPYYHGSRPHRFARIEVAVNVSPQRAVGQVEDGTADYAVYNEIGRSQAPSLAARYGPTSPAAKNGHRQYFVDAGAQLDFFVLNTHRSLFANTLLRQAVNYAIDRPALAALGDEFDPLPAHPTDHYLPPGIPGYRDISVYPQAPDLAKARALARGVDGRTAVLYTCNVYPCPQQAQIVKTDLAAIGIDVQVDTLPDQILFAKEMEPNPPFDLAWEGWIPDYLDPYAMLNALLEQGTAIPTLNDPTTAARLAAAAALSGPERYLTYAELDAEIARDAAPLAAFDNLSDHDLFSARIGCQVSGVYGMDLGALCIRHSAGTK